MLSLPSQDDDVTETVVPARLQAATSFWHGIPRPAVETLHWAVTLVGTPLLIGSAIASYRSVLEPRLLLWIAVIVLLELFPISTVEWSVFTVTDPIKAALAMTHPVLVVPAVIFVASCDPRELRREVGLRRALFNRSQSMIGWTLASMSFHQVASVSSSWPQLFLGSAVVSAVFYPLNVGIVGAAWALRSRLPLRQAVRHLLLDTPLRSVLGYLSFSLLGAVIAKSYAVTEGGEWVLVAAPVPLLSLARLTFVHLREAHLESERSRRGEALYRSIAERVSDERQDERQRIAAGLHDGVIPILESIGLLASSARARSDGAEDLEAIQVATQQGLSMLRGTVAGLRESALGDTGLAGSLRSLAASVARHVDVNLQVQDDARLVPAALELTIYQIAREAMANAVQHANASHVTVTLASTGDGFRLVVEDDGAGFDPKGVPSDHFGLALMRERALAAGARLAIEPSNHGTRVELAWPADRPARGG